MFNAIRADLYRMVKTKSFYVVAACTVVFLLMNLALLKTDLDMAETEQQTVSEETDETVNLGMSVSMDTAPGEEATIMDVVYSTFSSKFAALFLVVFVVLFSTADIHSGYLKNIGGQVANRAYLIISRAVCIVVFTGGFMVLSFFTLLAGMKLILGYVHLGSLGAVASYLGIQFVLYAALALIVMCISVIVKNNAISMTVGICLCMNVMTILYGLINQTAAKMGFENFDILKYTITGNILLLPPDMDKSIYLRCVGTAVVFMILSAVLGAWTLRKRDI